MWSAQWQLAFENVKTLLCAAPVRAAPCMDKPFKLEVDVSHIGAGAVLLQEFDVSPVVIYTDHNPLTFLCSLSCANV